MSPRRTAIVPALAMDAGWRICGQPCYTRRMGSIDPQRGAVRRLGTRGSCPQYWVGGLNRVRAAALEAV
jgi:hypothetical protein